ncbi:MAG: hypothetical protein H0X26_05845 [Alphaproteobacteria bacterium]|nr:hypothetical protein [Alphaproteobacteria bacterium]
MKTQNLRKFKNEKRIRPEERAQAITVTFKKSNALAVGYALGYLEEDD